MRENNTNLVDQDNRSVFSLLNYIYDFLSTFLH